MNGHPTTLQSAIQVFLEDAGLEGNTRNTYKWALQVFQRFCQQEIVEAGEIPLPSLGKNTLMRFAAWLKKRPDDEDREEDPRPYSDASRGLALSGVRRLMRFLVFIEAIDIDLTRANNAVKEVVSNHRTRRILSIEKKLPTILDYYGDMELPPRKSDSKNQGRFVILRNRAFVHTLLSTGARISEALSLNRTDVQDGRAEEIIVQGKGGHERYLFFTPEAQKAISAYCKERGRDGYEPLFISHGRNWGTAISRKTGWNIVKDAAYACGIPDVHPHSFRHWRASQLAEDGVPIQVIQLILGHADISTTRRYVHDNLAMVRETVSGSPPR